MPFLSDKRWLQISDPCVSPGQIAQAEGLIPSSESLHAVRTEVGNAWSDSIPNFNKNPEVPSAPMLPSPHVTKPPCYQVLPCYHQVLHQVLPCYHHAKCEPAAITHQEAFFAKTKTLLPGSRVLRLPGNCERATLKAVAGHWSLLCRTAYWVVHSILSQLAISFWIELSRSLTLALKCCAWR